MCYAVDDEQIALTVTAISATGLTIEDIHAWWLARLAVHSTFIAQSIYGAIQEYAGFDRPEWLDM